MTTDVDLDAAKEERHQQARLNAAMLLCAIVAVLCYMPFDYWMIAARWQALWLGRLLVVTLIVGCLLWQRRRPERSERSLLIGALGVATFFAWGAAQIDDPFALLCWNLSVAVGSFVLMPVVVIWRLANMLVHNLFMGAAYGLSFVLWSPFGFQELLQFGGVFLLLGVLISPLLTQLRYVNFARAASLRRELQKRNAELTVANERLTRQQDELMHLASFDIMTGLPNRRRGMSFLQGSLANCLREWQPLSLLLIDVDNLKVVNDTQGHAAGDHLICSVASAIAELVKDKSEIACRMGGDEFLVVMPNVADEAARERATRLARLLSSRRLEGCQEVVITASIGTTTYQPWREGPIDMDVLIQRADSEMYDNKRRSRQRHGQERSRADELTLGGGQEPTGGQ